MSESTDGICGAEAVFWPDEEACGAVCIKPAGHQPPDVHEDKILGEWDESDLLTAPGREGA